MTLAQALAPARSDWASIQQSYGSILSLIRELIGVQPASIPYLDIWPPGHKALNLLVPALFNLPPMLLRPARFKSLVGLAALSASRAAGCNYCMAHTCVFALKRGAPVDAVRAAATAADAAADPADAAVITMAAALASVPASLTPEHLAACAESADDLRWLAYAAVLMGFLNKFMDVMGVELEPGAIAGASDVLAPTGWTMGKHAPPPAAPPPPPPAAVVGDPAAVDGWGTYVRVLGSAPGAVMLEWGWLAGVPGTAAGAAGAAAVRQWLEAEVGFAFAVVERLEPARPRRAVAAVVRDCLDPKLSKVGLAAKCAAALVFARCVANPRLEQDVERMVGAVAAPNTWPEASSSSSVGAILEYAGRPTDGNGDGPSPGVVDARMGLIVEFVRAASSSPAVISDQMVSRITEQLEAAEIIELVVWLAVLQLLHRLDVFYAVQTG